MYMRNSPPDTGLVFPVSETEHATCLSWYAPALGADWLRGDRRQITSDSVVRCLINDPSLPVNTSPTHDPNYILFLVFQ